jgi:recombination protein RecT
MSNIKQFFEQDNVKNKFADLMGKNSTSFITSVMQIAMSNKLLANATPESVYTSAIIAATLNLPLNNSLGFAYIVPYKSKNDNGEYVDVAQFQLGYKGFKQLAQRSGQYVRINDTAVRSGEIVKHDRLTGEIEFKWIQDEEERAKAPIVGYVSYFKLINGFESTFYMTLKEVDAHAKRFSQTYKKGFGIWKDDFDSMALKTVCKLNLSKNGILSVDLQKAIVTDQSVIKDVDTLEVEYVDNIEIAESIALVHEDTIDQWIGELKACKTPEEVEKKRLKDKPKDKAILDLFEQRIKELS